MFAVRCAADILAFGGYSIGCDVVEVCAWLGAFTFGLYCCTFGSVCCLMGRGCTVLVAGCVVAFVLSSPRVCSPHICFADGSA